MKQIHLQFKHDAGARWLVFTMSCSTDGFCCSHNTPILGVGFFSLFFYFLFLSFFYLPIKNQINSFLSNFMMPIKFSQNRR